MCSIYVGEGDSWASEASSMLGCSIEILRDIPSPYAGGVQVGSPEPPFKINDIYSMHVVEVLVHTHLLV